MDVGVIDRTSPAHLVSSGEQLVLAGSDGDRQVGGLPRVEVGGHRDSLAL